MRLLKVTLHEEHRGAYSDKMDHDSMGIFFQEDESHIWIKPFKRDVEYRSFVGSPVRYLKDVVDIEELAVESPPEPQRSDVLYPLPEKVIRKIEKHLKNPKPYLRRKISFKIEVEERKLNIRLIFFKSPQEHVVKFYTNSRPWGIARVDDDCLSVISMMAGRVQEDTRSGLKELPDD